MALPNNNNNTYPVGIRNDGVVIDNRGLRGVGVRNSGSVVSLKWLDEAQLLANQRISV